MTTSVQARAKVNLSLEILGKRQDGYHEVRTVLQTVDLADVLEIAPGPDLSVQCSDPALDGPDNLVWQAATALARSKGRLPRASIFIKKRIPVAMGLGGGSSDAAAALASLNSLWELGWTPDQLADIAGELGTDVPFFLWGGTALATGRGEAITPLPPLPDGIPLTLVCPETTLADKTARLYSRVTPQDYSDGSAVAAVAAALAENAFTPDLGSTGLYNTFHRIALEAFPALRTLYQSIIQGIPHPVHLSGAGPALFFFPGGSESHRDLAEDLGLAGCRVYPVHTAGPGAHAGMAARGGPTSRSRE